MEKQKLQKLKWLKNNLDKARESKRKWNYKNRELKSKLQIGYKKRHPEVIKAHNFKNNHRLKLKLECEFCGFKERLEGHHPDYNLPDFIITVCKLCHSKIHFRNKN